MEILDSQGVQSGRAAQEFQATSMVATVDVMAAILSKIADQDVKIDDLIIKMGRGKTVWDGTDEEFQRDKFDSVAEDLQKALTDPESKTSFRVYLEYPDGERVEIFRQTGGKVVKDDYNLANDLRAAYALDAVEQFTPERGEQDFILSYADAQAQGMKVPSQPSAGRDSQADPAINPESVEPSLPTNRAEVQAELITDPWTDQPLQLENGSFGDLGLINPSVEALAQTQLNDRPPVETQIEQVPDAIATPVEQSTQPADISQLTYSQQRNLAALNDVNGQIAELDRRAAAGMTYIADPEKNPGYKALLGRAEVLREALGDLAILADVPAPDAIVDVAATSVADDLPVPEIYTVSQDVIDALDREISNNSVEQESTIDVQATSVPESVEQRLTRQLASVENTLAETYDQYEEKAAELGSDRVDVQLISLETKAQSLQDQLNELAPGAMTIAEPSAMGVSTIYEDVFIDDVLNDSPLDDQVQKLLVSVFDVRSQIDSLRNEMNGQLQGTVQLSDAIAQNVKDPAIERWADKIGGVAEGQATNWREQLRNAVAVTVEFAQQIYESPVGQYVSEQTVAGLDAVGSMASDKMEKDIQTTKDFVSDFFGGSMPEHEVLDAGIASLIDYQGVTEDDRGMASHEGYTFLKDGDRHGVWRESDGANIYKEGNFTGKTTQEDRDYLKKFSNVAAAAKPLIEASQQSNAPKLSGGASA